MDELLEKYEQLTEEEKEEFIAFIDSLIKENQ